jgi:hypothetical protein
MLLAATHELVQHLDTGFGTAIAVPNPAPVPPPGSEKLNTILSYIKWLALIGAVAGFFAGLIVFAAGRIVDHRRAGTYGSMMILSSMGVALLFGLGPQLIQSFASG